jgi:hypothetical protein
MQRELADIKLNVCPNCGGELQRGFLIGKQNRIRWSKSSKGMTIFHGVPLIQLNKGFWLKRQWWLYAPNIPAERCPKCHLAIFAYNNDAEENIKNELWACTIIGGMLTFIAILVGCIAILGWLTQPPMTVFLRLILFFASIVPLVLGGIFLGHVFTLIKRNASLKDNA